MKATTLKKIADLVNRFGEQRIELLLASAKSMSLYNSMFAEDFFERLALAEEQDHPNHRAARFELVHTLHYRGVHEATFVCDLECKRWTMEGSYRAVTHEAPASTIGEGTKKSQ